MRAAARLQRRLSFEVGRFLRATLGFGVSGAFVVLLWQGWFPDLRQPGAESSRVAAAAILTAMLAGKIAARVRTAERRRSPRREAFSDAELGLLLLTAIYVLLGTWWTINTIVERPKEALAGTAIVLLGVPGYLSWKRTRNETR